VTQRAQAEANLRANEVFLSTVVRHAPVGIGVFESSRGCLLANQVFQAMRGLFDDALPAAEKLVRRYFDKDGQPLSVEDLPRASALRTGQPVIGTTVGIEVEDGRQCFLEVNAVPIPESPNQIVIIAIDITQKIEQERALRDYSGRLDALINSALDGILTLDEKGNILLANPALVKLCGYDTSELLQHSVGMLAPDLLKGKDAQLRVPHVSADKNALLMNEVVLSRKDGSQFLAEISLSSFEFARKRHFSAIVRDIQERKLMRARTEFITMVSHELRAPLNTVIGLGEALAEDEREPLTPRQSERIGTMLVSARHLSEVVKDILDLSRIELGMLRLERAAVSIAWLCDLSVGMVADAAERKRIVLRKHVECGELKFLVDGRRVLQILVNLLDNAIKFTAPGGQVLLEVRPRDAAVEFAIHDSGIGIAEADFERLFKPFCQVDSTTNRKFQGTGLGLFLAQRLANLHTGGISVRSTPGTGSCFTLSLPKTTPPSEPAHVARPPDRG
jgi:protein-histidine pros-kinase